MNVRVVENPLIPEVGILALVPDQWYERWQPRHQILSRISRYFHVVWVNPAQHWQRSLKWPRTAAPSSPKEFPALSVYDPEVWLPTFFRPRVLAEISFRERLRRAGRLLATKGVTKRILSIWRPDFAGALNWVDCHASCYHVDDEYSFSPSDLPIQQQEAWLLQSVNQVFVTSPGLMDRKGAFNSNTQFIPNGVDFHAYSRPQPEPGDLAGIPRPRIGYSGWLKKQLDWPLLLELSERHPDWSFVFVGPQSPHPEIQTPIELMKRRPNVYMLGGKPTEALSSYPQHFDVCLMPYAANDYTKYIYPLKLHEYLAAGRPTVGRRIRSLEKFSNLVGLVETCDAWSAEIQKALSPEANSPHNVRVRQAVAQQFDWDLIVGQVVRILAHRLGPEYEDRVESICRTEVLYG
jgi:glycosyltransferase involved in cell wall biosynthesis